MITHEAAAPFGARVTDIQTPQFNCVITTAKESIFQGLSTMVVLVDSNRSPVPVAKIIYQNSVPKKDRQMLHHEISESINKHGEDGYHIAEAIHMVFAEMKLKKNVKECITKMPYG